EFAHDAADRIYHAIVRGQDGEARIKAILRPFKGEEIGTTRYVSFDTTKPTYATREDKSHVHTSSPTPIRGSRRWPRCWRNWTKSSAT
ncbi:MAG: hypothetical protein ABI665_09735, partial [Vicinamibacterales bacterium]